MARVASCDDVRFDGPMKQIKYEYLGEAEYPHAPIGVVRREKNLYDQTISEAIYPASCFTPPSTNPIYYQRD